MSGLHRKLAARLAALTLATCALLLAVAISAAAAPVTFGSGQLDWGVKSSFRSYILTIAHGSYTASDGAEVVGPGGVVRFDVLGGSYDDATGAGELTIGGTVRFEGHGGSLDMTMRNLCVTFAGGAGTVYGDVVSKERSSGEIDSYTGIALVDMASVPAPMPNGEGGLAWPSIDTTLNTAAVPAFGQYPAGEQFDPLAPLTVTGGTPQPRPSGGPCRSVPKDGGGDGGGGGGTGGGSETGGGGPVAPSKIRAPRVLGAGTVFVPRARAAKVGTLHCGSAPCAIAVPKSVKVTIAGKRYEIKVLAPKRLAPRRSGKLRLKLTRAARKALVGRKTTAKLRVVVVADGQRTVKRFSVNLKARRVGHG